MTFLDPLLADGIPLWLIFALLFASIAFLALALAQAIRALRRPGLAGLLYAAQIILGFWAIILGALLPWTVPVVAIASLWVTWKLRREDPDSTWLPTLSGLLTVAMCLGVMGLA